MRAPRARGRSGPATRYVVTVRGLVWVCGGVYFIEQIGGAWCGMALVVTLFL